MRKEKRRTYKYGKKTSRLENSLLLVAFLTAAALTGCGQTADQAQAVIETDVGSGDGAEASGDRAETESPAADDSETSTSDQAGIVFDDRALSETETAIYEKIQRAAGQDIVLFDCADFDGDGQAEGFALAGIREDGFVSGTIWFAKESGDAENIVPACLAGGMAGEDADGASGGDVDSAMQAGSEVCLQDFSQVYELPDGKKLWQVETFGGSVSASLLWSAADGAAQESVLSGKGAQFEKTQAGDYLLYKSDLDACTDGTGRTMKPCYFYYEDGEFHEYGAVSVSQSDLYEIPGFEEAIRSYEDRGFWNRRILLRGNGMVQVSLQDRSNNCWFTLAMEDGKLETVQEGEGLAGLLVGGIADQTWRGGENALKDVWDKRIEENPGVSVRVYPGETVYYDLDGDGMLEAIRYQEKESEEVSDFVTGLTVSVNGEEVWKNEEAMSEWCRMYVTDLDSSDGKTELIAEYCSANDVVVSVRFLQYENKKMTEIADLCGTEIMGSGSFFRHQGGPTLEDPGFDIPGDKTVTALADTPVWRNGFGSYYVKIQWQYADSALTEAVPTEYELAALADGQLWDYRLATPITLYQEAECINPVYEAQPGETLHAIAIKPMSGEEAPLYIKVETANENAAASVMGWIAVGDADIFEEIPAWG